MKLSFDSSLVRMAGCALCAAVIALPAHAHEGHDDAPAAPVQNAAPRFAASSELFELVGVVDGRKISLYLDHAPDNSPVPEAKLELEVGGKALAVQRVGAGEYQAELASPLADGQTPVTATVVAGQESDLLAADIDWHAPSAATAPAAARSPWLWAGAGLGALVLAAWAWARRAKALVRVGGAA